MGETVAFDRVVIDRDLRRVYVGGAQVPVSSTGWRLLLALVERHGELLSKADLMTLVWGSSPITENALHVHIAALRKAIGNHLIITHSGIGYRFVGQIGSARAPDVPAAVLKPPVDGAARLLGREAELRALRRALERHRCVTLAGPGGVGKTSLARALARTIAPDFADGVWFVELAAQHERTGVLDAIKTALHLEGGFGTPPLQDIMRNLQPLRAVLVLDNCEHLLLMLSELAQTLLEAAPTLKIVTTSREALACAAEHVFAVRPLPVPNPVDETLKEAQRSPAFRLFVDRITALDPQFMIDPGQVPVVARICRSLDGLPLALELVAGWAGALGLEMLEEKLNTAPFAWAHARRRGQPRHYDLRAALEWSHHLLSASDQVALRRIAVFAQDFSLTGAEDVAGDGLLPGPTVFTHVASLVQKSLLTVTPGTTPPMYRLLETTRAFALEKLHAAGEQGVVRDKHAAYVLRVLTTAETEWDTISGEAWLARYGSLIAEIRGALDWTIAGGGETATGIAIAATSWPLWRELSLRVEGARRLEAALAAVTPETPAAVRALLQHGIGMMLCDGQPDLARVAFGAAAKLFRASGDRRHLAAVLLALAFTLFLAGEINATEAALQEGDALLHGLPSQRWRAAVLALESLLHMHHCRYDAALETGRRTIRFYEAIGAERSVLAARSNMIEIALCRNDIAAAIAEARALAARLRTTTHRVILGMMLVNLVAALVRGGEFGEALDSAREAAPLLQGNRPLIVLIDHLALGCALAGHAEDAAILSGAADYGYAARNLPRQYVEQLASAELQALLARDLPQGETARLAAYGASLPEEVAWQLATRQGV